MLIGLASKNAILIVEFANQSRGEGKTIAQAALEAVRQRLRPILMTTISSLAGFFPLVTASRAGAASRWSLGTAVFGGLISFYYFDPTPRPSSLCSGEKSHRLFLQGQPSPAAPSTRTNLSRTNSHL